MYFKFTLIKYCIIEYQGIKFKFVLIFTMKHESWKKCHTCSGTNRNRHTHSTHSHVHGPHSQITPCHSLETFERHISEQEQTSRHILMGWKEFLESIRPCRWSSTWARETGAKSSLSADPWPSKLYNWLQILYHIRLCRVPTSPATLSVYLGQEELAFQWRWVLRLLIETHPNILESRCPSWCRIHRCDSNSLLNSLQRVKQPSRSSAPYSSPGDTAPVPVIFPGYVSFPQSFW